MKRSVALALLHVEFPDKNIVCLPDDDDPQEVIVELERAEDDSYSVAIALIQESLPHRNPGLVEAYLVEEGQLVIYIDEDMEILEQGGGLTFDADHVHWAIALSSEPARVRVTSRPAWKPEHNVLV